MKTVHLGIIGLGTVGHNFAILVKQKASFLEQNLKARVKIYAIAARSTKSLSKIDVPFKTQDPLEICRHPQVDIVVELAGGYEDPLNWVMASLKHKKQVVTANKALLAKYGAQLFPFAHQQGSSIFFEAAVGGSIPVIRSIQELLSGNQINSFACIINGTCNYMLTQMKKFKHSFDVVLKEAQEKGYAEADPSFDIEGTDTAHKIALLASLATQKYIPFENIFVDGITKITPLDLKMASDLGFSIKLLGQFINNSPDEVFVGVFPTLVPQSHQLSSIQGVLNAVYFQGSASGPIFLTGAGAGGLATASAVMSDLTHACIAHLSQKQISPPFDYIQSSNTIKLSSIEELQTEFYLRIITKNKSGALAKISQTLAHHKISIEAVIQKPTQQDHTPIVIRTHIVSHKKIKQALTKIDSLDIVIGESLFLHIYQEL